MTFKPEGFSEEIFRQRYSLTPEESWEEACRRVARQMASAEQPEKITKYENKFYKELADNNFVCGGRIWYNSGRPSPQLLNCFVLEENLDSKEGWANLSKEMIITSMTGGGCGIDFSDVRPRGAVISGQRGKAPGSVELMKLINGNGDPIRAGGSRRVALMFSLDITHPDIMEFLDAKLKKGELQNANVSLRCKNTTGFIEAIKEDGDWELSWKGQYKKTIKAKDLWDRIVTNAYNSAEPGFLNWEMVSKESNIHYIEDLVTTNPCGEIALSSHDCCCLGHVVLPRFIKDGKVNWEMLGNTVRIGVRFLDNVLSVNHYPLPEMKDKSSRLRRIGLGTTGLADMMVLAGVRYGSDEGNKFVDKLYRFISKQSYEASVFLAVEKGSFPDCDTEQHVKSGFIKRMTPKIKNLISEHGIRNCAILTQAPTGCQRPDTLVSTDSGLLMLGEIVDEKGLEWQNIDLQVNQETEIVKSQKGYVNGYADTKKITLASGLELECTPNHQYRVFKDKEYIWIKANEVSIGDKVVCRLGEYNKKDNVELDTNIEHYHNSRNIRLPTHMTPDFVWLLGLIYADGSVHKKGIRIACNASEKDFNDIVVDKIKSVFNWNATRYTDRGCETIQINSQILLSFLDKNNILKPKSYEINFPKAVRASSKETIEAFIDGYYWGDGHALTSNHNMRVFDTVSKTMAQQLMVVLRALGRNSIMRVKTFDDSHYGDRPLYSIKEISYGTFGHEDKRRYLSKTRQANCIDADTLFEGAFLDEITSIEDSKCMTLDVEVPHRNTYMANSVISHNTVSLLSGNCSSGIEPMFSYAYLRKYYVEDERKEELVFHPLFMKFMDEDKDVSHFVASHDLTVREHMEIQRIIQKHVDNAVSKTINMAEDYSIKDMSEMWLEYLPLLKGTTFYRTNSRKFIDADGNEQAPPLTPLTLEEAKNKYTPDDSISILIEKEADCPNGLCEL